MKLENIVTTIDRPIGTTVTTQTITTADDGTIHTLTNTTEYPSDVANTHSRQKLIAVIVGAVLVGIVLVWTLISCIVGAIKIRKERREREEQEGGAAVRN